VKGRVALLAGGVAAAGAAAYRAVRRRSFRSAPDPRAEELRDKLRDSREMIAEREEFEAAQTPVDRAEAPAPETRDRRRQIHEEGRAAIARMRGSEDEPPSASGPSAIGEGLF
jgi:hypothetical protein